MMPAVEWWCRVTLIGPGGDALAGWSLEGPGQPDLEAVDRVARLALGAGRLGGRVVLSDVDPDLRSLLDLAALPVEVEG